MRKKQNYKFHIKLLEEIKLPTEKKEIRVDVTFTDNKIQKKQYNIKGKLVNLIFKELISDIGLKNFQKDFQKNISYVFQNAWLQSMTEEELGKEKMSILKEQIYIKRKLNFKEKIKDFLFKVKYKVVKWRIRRDVRLSKTLLKTLKTEIGRIIKYNIYNIKDPRKLKIFEFYIFILSKTIDLGDGLNLLNKNKQYRNELILSRSLLELNFKFFYLVKSWEDNILNFIVKTGTRNIEVRLSDKYKNMKDIFENEFSDLQVKDNKFRHLDQIAKELNKEKYYNYFFSLYSRFAHTNAMVIFSYLNDFKTYKKFYNNEAGDHYKNNNQYYVMSNIFFYEIITEIFDFMVKNNYIPSENFLYRNFLEQLRQDKMKWERLNKKMEKISFPY